MLDHETTLPESLSDRLRLLLLLDACEAANIAPVPVMQFHALAFLANVLGPVWSVESYDGKILKRKGGPFYPELQRELDRLVGLGIVSIQDVRHEKEDGRWRLEGSFALNLPLTSGLAEAASFFVVERGVIVFLRRLAFATAMLKHPLEELVSFDATWSDQRTGTGDVIDFSEWRKANYSAFVADRFDESLPTGLKTGRGDKLQLYLSFLERRAYGTS